MTVQTDDLRIRSMQPLLTPESLLRDCVRTAEATATVLQARGRLQRILRGHDDRLAVVIGPCSIHDVVAAREYAGRLAAQRERFADTLEIIMRVYFEKPRTTVGWKGLINDPGLDGSFRINEGLRLARELLIDINHQGLPAGCEFLDIFTPQYLADLVSWGAIGARTTESQVHREMTSGLSCPVGFKNGTDGNVKIAIDAVQAASHPHHFLAVMKDGRSAIASTAGNADCHVILRGGRAPNFDAESVEAAARALQSAGCQAQLMIDASHGNSSKKPGKPAAGHRRHRRADCRWQSAHRGRHGGEPPGGRSTGDDSGPGPALRSERDRRVHRLGDEREGAGKPVLGRQGSTGSPLRSSLATRRFIAAGAGRQ